MELILSDIEQRKACSKMLEELAEPRDWLIALNVKDIWAGAKNKTVVGYFSEQAETLEKALGALKERLKNCKAEKLVLHISAGAALELDCFMKCIEHFCKDYSAAQDVMFAFKLNGADGNASKVQAILVE